MSIFNVVLAIDCIQGACAVAVEGAFDWRVV